MLDQIVIEGLPEGTKLGKSDKTKDCETVVNLGCATVVHWGQTNLKAKKYLMGLGYNSRKPHKW